MIYFQVECKILSIKQNLIFLSKIKLLIDTSSKHSLKRETDKDFLPTSIKDDIGREDDDPLSLVDASITIVGIILAFFTIALPSLSILLERPLPHDKGPEINQFFKKDGY